jgi:tetratricopeptide (TPR) repeat protein
MRRMISTIAAALFVLPLASMSAFSAGDGSGSSDTVQNCKKGEVWDKQKRKCVIPGQGALDDESIYEAGRDLALAERYDEAIAVLSLAADKNDAGVLNYLGYAHRKQGRVLVGMGYYEEAIKADPTYTLVREYMGEAHLQMGNLDGAKLQLAEIEKLCGGQDCHEYEELSAEIEKFEAKGG